MAEKSNKNQTKAEAQAEARAAKNQARAAKAAATRAKAEAAKEKAKAARLRAAESRTGKALGGFMTFIRTQGVVGLAVGLAIGTQANSTVKSIVEGLINPLVAFILGSDTGLVDRKWYVVGQDNSTTNYLLTLGNRQLVFAWGQVLSSLITLVAVAAVIYFVVKGFKFDKLDKAKE
ncbi:MAG TPA: MscL family protein [Candidatus Saccharimonadales bacterium]|nr:MscL family protein [Candidatus Saccharimonadales bacterium]